MLGGTVMRTARAFGGMGRQMQVRGGAMSKLPHSHSLFPTLRHTTFAAQAQDSREPSIDEARCLPRKFRECNNDIIYTLSIQGEHGARKERLLREIMRVDECTWKEARAKLAEMDSYNDTYHSLVTLPYKLGLGVALFASISSIPLVFHRDSAVWFNNIFVHEDLPDGGLESLDTFWKVGSWTWGWMEPYLGTASFVLLGLQFSRAQMKNINYKPYTEAVLSWRANRLAAKFPQYNRVVVRDFSKSDPWQN
eukprot:CAMPEP_0119122706 /NCGR_PEP_ID=MMETSP1310-20130426/2882_1 /TAXON_ID=464262 /ORGANISM="Genus nov. species nov., Strain RCC2339" /LENGTH=250 /DNA_ID=CAMNT_0007112405 /DNA_START=40 /DNA_END=792 /DNA_ORIENTATION=+